MPCCVLCPNYKLVNGEPRVNNECPYYVADDAPPRWFLLKEKASCCSKCENFREKDEEKFWWCMRPFSFEINPLTAAEAVRFSSRAVVKTPEK